ncbi:MAG: hypothetical protein ABI587_16755 [Gemmatimonadales bacterium]
MLAPLFASGPPAPDLKHRWKAIAMGQDRRSALRELLVRAWQPLLKRSREIDAFVVDRRARGWRNQPPRREAGETAIRAGGHPDPAV